MLGSPGCVDSVVGAARVTSANNDGAIPIPRKTSKCSAGVSSPWGPESLLAAGCHRPASDHWNRRSPNSAVKRATHSLEASSVERATESPRATPEARSHTCQVAQRSTPRPSEKFP
jgi:hypothetical protein